ARFRKAPEELIGECHAVATRAGYPVACPSLIPAFPPAPTLKHIFGYRYFFFVPARGVGIELQSVTAPEPRHLIIETSPRVVSPLRFIYSSPTADLSEPNLLENLGPARIEGVTGTWVKVPSDAQTEWAGHEVLIWTVDGHSYGVA